MSTVRFCIVVLGQDGPCADHMVYILILRLSEASGSQSPSRCQGARIPKKEACVLGAGIYLAWLKHTYLAQNLFFFFFFVGSGSQNHQLNYTCVYIHIHFIKGPTTTMALALVGNLNNSLDVFKSSAGLAVRVQVWAYRRQGPKCHRHIRVLIWYIAYRVEHIVYVYI